MEKKQHNFSIKGKLLFMESKKNYNRKNFQDLQSYQKLQDKKI